DEGVPGADVRDLQGTVAAVVFARAALVRLGPDEVRQHALPVPAAVAGRCPGVVILALAADVDEAVDRARAAERLAAGPVDAPAVHVGIGVGVVAPVDAVAPHRLAVADRQMDPRRGVARTGFEEEDADGGIFAQPGRENAAGRPRADDDVVEFT